MHLSPKESVFSATSLGFASLIRSTLVEGDATLYLLRASYALKDHGDALSHPNAHGRERQAAAATPEFERGRPHKTRARHPQRVAKRDSSSVRIDVLSLVGKAKPAQAGEGLCGEGFVDLDYVEVLRGEPQAIA